MANRLNGKRVAILATDGFEQSELTSPKQALEQEGAQVDVVSPKQGRIQGMNHHDKADSIAVDRALDSASPDDYDALMLPGGVANPDELRIDPKAVQFAKAFMDAGKPVAALCHGPWLLVEAGATKGRKLTSWPSLKTDIENSGGQWLDQPVVTDKGLVTSRKPDDMAQFNAKMIEEFCEGRHAGR